MKKKEYHKKCKGSRAYVAVYLKDFLHLTKVHDPDGRSCTLVRLRTT